MISSGSLVFMPAGTGQFLRRRLAEITGLGLICVAALWVMALSSHNGADPSFNLATEAAPTNLLGYPGADFSDLLFHIVGWAAFLPALSLTAWGLRLFQDRPPPYLWLHGFGTLAATLLLAMGFAATGDSPLPSLVAGPGGAGGLILLNGVVMLLQSIIPDASATSVGVAVFCCGLVLASIGLGLAPSDWRAIGRGLVGSGRWISRHSHGLVAFAGRFELPTFSLFRRHEEPDRETDPDLGGETARSSEATPPNLVTPKAARPKASRQQEASTQPQFNFDTPAAFRAPPLDLLSEPKPQIVGKDDVDREGLEQNASMLSTVLDDFGVRGNIVKVRPGPVVTLYELEPAPGTKSARVIGLADDIARSMSAVSARVAVVPGRNVIGIELPNTRRESVSLRELLAADGFERASGHLVLALGKDIGGAPIYVDIARMPHLLIAGTTGSGKSVAINSMIVSLLYRLSPETCRFILIDPKMLELSVYDGIPHLLSPVVTEPGKAVVALKWTVREMEERYRSMSQLGVRNIAGYNERVAQAKKKGEKLTRRVQTGFNETGEAVFEDQTLDLEPLPLIVVVVDEMADLMLVAGKDIEAAVQRLSQMARAAGIHLIMATQRPSVDVITGTIKANFPTRISFQVTSKIDSRTILGEPGAEQLLGQGDMLFMAAGGRVTRVHGPFVSDSEVEKLARHLRAQGQPQYLAAVTEADDEAGGDMIEEDDGEADELYDEAVAIVLRERKASTSFVQRRLQIGYNRAARLIERMEKSGLVSSADRVGRREVLAGDDD